MSTRARRGFDALGKGEAEGKAAPAQNFVSRGLTRSRTDRLQVVSGSSASAARRRVAPRRAAATSPPSAGAATALKAEPEAKLSPTEQLDLRIDPQDARVHAKASASEKRAEARAKGYEGEACGECGNFTLLQKRHLHEMRYVWGHDGVFVTV